MMKKKKEKEDKKVKEDYREDGQYGCDRIYLADEVDKKVALLKQGLVSRLFEIRESLAKEQKKASNVFDMYASKKEIKFLNKLIWGSEGVKPLADEVFGEQSERVDKGDASPLLRRNEP